MQCSGTPNGSGPDQRGDKGDDLSSVVLQQPYGHGHPVLPLCRDTPEQRFYVGSLHPDQRPVRHCVLSASPPDPLHRKSPVLISLRALLSSSARSRRPGATTSGCPSSVRHGLVCPS